MQAQVKLRRHEIDEMPMLSTEETYKRNYQLGLIHGIKFAMSFPKKQIAVLEEEFTKQLARTRET